MKKIIDTKRTPPGGWRYKNPEDGRKFQATSLDNLLISVQKYREINKLFMFDNEKMLEIIQEWICNQPGCAAHCNNIEQGRSVEQYIAGAKAAIAITLSDDPYVSQEEANRRAEICVDCPHNIVNNKDSRLSRYTDRYVKKLVGARQTYHDKNLFSCDICSCVLRTKVHISSEIINEYMKPSVFARLPRNQLSKSKSKIFSCWQLEKNK